MTGVTGRGKVNPTVYLCQQLEDRKVDDDEIFDRYEQELVWMIRQAGGVNALGRDMGISPSTISRWLHRNRKPSAYHAIAIETYTNGAIKRETIRPDIFCPGAIMPSRVDMSGFKRCPFATLDKGEQKA